MDLTLSMVSFRLSATSIQGKCREFGIHSGLLRASIKPIEHRCNHRSPSHQDNISRAKKTNQNGVDHCSTSHARTRYYPFLYSHQISVCLHSIAFGLSSLVSVRVTRTSTDALLFSTPIAEVCSTPTVRKWSVFPGL